GCCFPSIVLALPCRLNPCERSSWCTVSALTLCPRAVSSAASVRTDLTVHRSGDSGSPRSSGSTSASSAGTSPGSVTAARLRPPPSRRARPSGSSPPSSSATPSDTVASRTPARYQQSRQCDTDPAASRTPQSTEQAPLTVTRCEAALCWRARQGIARLVPGRCLHQVPQLSRRALLRVTAPLIRGVLTLSD